MTSKPGPKPESANDYLARIFADAPLPSPEQMEFLRRYLVPDRATPNPASKTA